jgi:hypothetical protein
MNPAEVFQELQEDDEPCYGKKCTANEHCCPGSVCVDVDGSEYTKTIIINLLIL